MPRAPMCLPALAVFALARHVAVTARRLLLLPVAVADATADARAAVLATISRAIGSHRPSFANSGLVNPGVPVALACPPRASLGMRPARITSTSRTARAAPCLAVRCRLFAQTLNEKVVEISKCWGYILCKFFYIKSVYVNRFTF